ncbi:MAG TPA: hypothetical protein VMR70_00460 [Flavisolibacter sp.]|nr:hypothetical protein [Flavisolibacter sp.]
MRHILFFFSLLFSITTYAQDDFQLKTITGKGKTSVGGYGTVVNEVTTVTGKGNYSLGGYGGVLLNHRLLLGGQGKVIFFRWDNQPRTFVYFGPYTEYHFRPAQLFHASLGIMGGMGVLSNRANHNGNLVFVTEPRASLHVNITPFMRASVSAGYRYAANDKYTEFSKTDFNGITTGVGFSFGKF